MKKLLVLIFIIILIISIFPRCAKIVSPSGGPKDTIAPVLLRSMPAINSVNFKGEKITLTFDEFIQLKDIQKKLAISPPMIKRPELNQRGKTLEIKLKEALQENTTYTIYFADAIVDNNEGNPIKNLVFAFSTGDVIDSLVVSGKVTNAFALTPEENVFVMLYDNQHDTMPIKTLPRYLTRTDKKGFFTFKNIQYNDYKVFALNDNNTNYKFDQVTEAIAFLSDTLKKGLLKNPSKLDTSTLAMREIYLNMFNESPRIQSLTGFSRTQRRKVALSFNRKPEGDVTIRPLNFTADSSWYIQETSQLRDSLIYWITNDRISAMDTLKVQVLYLKTDSLQRLQPELDTVKFIYSEKETKPDRKGKKEKSGVKKTSFKVNCSIKNAQIVKPTVPLELLFPTPIKGLNDSLYKFTNLTDSSEIKGIRLEKDSLNSRIYRFNYSWGSDINYKLVILPGAFTSINSFINDTLKLSFIGANPDNFGILNITLLNAKETVIIELLDEKKTQVLDSKIAQTGEKVSFKYINPGKYTLRFIEDTNMNGKWDTGWYLKGIQPESVTYYYDSKTKGVFNVRANWENDVTFDFVKK